MNPDELKPIALLRAMDDESLARLAATLEPKAYVTGQVIFSEGDPGDAMYFVVHGHVRVEVRTGAGNSAHKTLTVLETGDYFGEMSLFDQKPRSASAVAVSDTQLLRLSKTGFDALLSRSSEAGMGVLFAMIRTSSDRIRRLSSQIVVYDEIGKAIGESTNLQALLDVVVQQLCRATSADWGLLLLKPEFASGLEVRSAEALPLTPAQKEQLANGQGFLSRFLEDPREMLARSFFEEEPFKSFNRLGFELPAFLLTPILVENQWLGIIALGARETGQFDANDQNLARGVARQTAQAILNARHREEEQARSQHSRRFVRF